MDLLRGNIKTLYFKYLSAALAWIGLILFERPLLTFFGADETLLALAQRYMIPVKVVFPLFLFNQMLAAFLRNDGAPALATLGVLSGGIFNVFGDWFFVFPCDMGVYGAGLATALGSAVSFLVMLTHFASRKNTLRLVNFEIAQGKDRRWKLFLLHHVCLAAVKKGQYCPFFIISTLSGCIGSRGNPGGKAVCCGKCTAQAAFQGNGERYHGTAAIQHYGN